MSVDVRSPVPAITGTPDPWGPAGSVKRWDRAPPRARVGVRWSLPCSSASTQAPGTQPSRGPGAAPRGGGSGPAGVEKRARKGCGQGWSRAQGSWGPCCHLPGEGGPHRPLSLTQKTQPAIPERLLKAGLCPCVHACACIPSGMKEQPRNTGSFSLGSERWPAQAPTAQVGSRDSTTSVSLQPPCQRHKLIQLSAEAGPSSSQVHKAGTEVERLVSSALYLHTAVFSLLSCPGAVQISDQGRVNTTQELIQDASCPRIT